MSAPLAGGEGAAGPSAAALGPASVLLLASIFELAAAASLCASDGCGGSRPYGLACGAMSAVAAVALLAQTLALPLPVALPPKLPATLTLLLLAWWSAGCLVLTFIGPFTQLGNGHLSTWGALLASAAAALPHHRTLAAGLDRFSRLARGELGLVALLGVCSAVAALQAGCCYVFATHSPVDAWALVVGFGSAAACVGLVRSPQLVAQHARPIAAGLLGWWVQGLIVTFIPNHFSGRCEETGDRASGRKICGAEGAAVGMKESCVSAHLLGWWVQRLVVTFTPKHFSGRWAHSVHGQGADRVPGAGSAGMGGRSGAKGIANRVPRRDIHSESL